MLDLTRSTELEIQSTALGLLFATSLSNSSLIRPDRVKEEQPIEVFRVPFTSAESVHDAANITTMSQV